MFNLIRLPLQFFAEDGAGAGAASAGADGYGQPAGGEGKQTPPTFDELLKGNKEYQAEFDRRMNKGLETARTKWDAEKQAELTEQEKLAKMKADEKAQYELEKHFFFISMCFSSEYWSSRSMSFFCHVISSSQIAIFMLFLRAVSVKVIY